jgi:hypothetical protein
MNICDILNRYNPDVPVDREDFDEAWVPLMDLTAEECKVEVNVPVDSASVSKTDFPLRFVDVAPKAFLQIRHAAGISSREYAHILGKRLAATALVAEAAVLAKHTVIFCRSRQCSNGPRSGKGAGRNADGGPGGCLFLLFA